MYKDISEIEILHLDHTSRCNLMCPQCPRTANNGSKLNPRLPITDLTLDDYKILLEPFEKEKISFLKKNLKKNLIFEINLKINLKKMSFNYFVFTIKQKIRERERERERDDRGGTEDRRRVRAR